MEIDTSRLIYTISTSLSDIEKYIKVEVRDSNLEVLHRSVKLLQSNSIIVYLLN